MARNPFTVTDKLREKVRSLAAVGVRQDDIAKIVDCSPKTLRKHFRRELDRAGAEANAMIAGSLYQAAMNGNVTAMIFWLKVRAHWKETMPPEPAEPDGEPARPPATIVILPDNGRDPELVKKFAPDKKMLKRLGLS